MKQKIQIGVLILVLLFQLFAVIPAWASASYAGGCQSPCSCGPGWYCSSDMQRIIAYHIHFFGWYCEAIDEQWCYYGCECCPCDVDDVCAVEGACS